jgi:cell division protease FtsH
VAYHEAGHTLIGFLLKNDPVHKVTIAPRGHRLGVTIFTPQDDHHLRSKEYYEGKLVESLAGYASENLIFGEQNVTNGSSEDIKTATAIANAMVTEWGFSSLGPIHNLKSFDKALAEKEIRALMDKSHKRAKELLEKNIDKLHKLAKALLERESLDAKEIEKLIG